MNVVHQIAASGLHMRGRKRGMAHVAMALLILAAGSASAGVSATGGMIVNYTQNGTNYAAHIFT